MSVYLVLPVALSGVAVFYASSCLGVRKKCNFFFYIHLRAYFMASINPNMAPAPKPGTRVWAS